MHNIDSQFSAAGAAGARNRLRRWSCFALLALPWLLSSRAHGQVIIAVFDMFNASGTTFQQPFYQGYQIMQTFTATSTGTLLSVDVSVHQVNSSTTAPLTVKVYALAMSDYNGLQPTGEPLSTGVLSSTDPQFATFSITWKTVPMSETILTAGVQYGLVLDTGPTAASDYAWYSKYGGDLYPGGNEAIAYPGSGGVFAQQSYDMGFRLNAVPEPGITFMLAAGAMAMALLYRRQRLT